MLRSDVTRALMRSDMPRILRWARRALSAGSKKETDIALAHSSWFCIPEQDMKGYELLARGSAFCVFGPETGVTIALSSAHVSAPHRYRRYFPAEWLSFVQDKHVEVRLDVRSSDGRSILPAFGSQPLLQAFRHATLDVAAAIVSPPGSSIPHNVRVLNLSEKEPKDAHGREVLIAGHEVEEDGADRPGESDGIVRRLALCGRVSLTDGSARGFVYTGKEDTVMGMCGGPVVLGDQGDDSVVIGMLEGLVPRLAEGEEPASEQHRAICGHSVYITAEELRHFVRDVEREWLRTGDAQSEKKQQS